MTIKKYIVSSAVTDLRKEPIPLKIEGERDLFQESQLIYGEKVIGYEEIGEWIKVEAIEQKKSVHKKWIGYPGWVKKKDLVTIDSFPEYDIMVTAPWAKIIGTDLVVPMGTRLKSIRREKDFVIIRLAGGSEAKIAISDIAPRPLKSVATNFIGAPYFWGGRCPYTPHNAHSSSVDCSSLVQLIYRTQGLELPRNAHDQYLCCKKVSQLEFGDLAFHIDKNPKIMSHVMFYLGNHLFLEACLEAKRVRVITAEEKSAPLIFMRPLQSVSI